MRAGSWALGIAAIVLAAGISTASKSPAPPGPDTDNIVAGRQAGFLLSAALFGGMKGAIDRGDEVKTQAFAARSLARWAKALPGMFPAGSGTAASGALPTVWTDRAGFAAKAADYTSAADKLAQLAGANDKASFAAQWAVVRQTCSACHDVYRKPDERPKG